MVLFPRLRAGSASLCFVFMLMVGEGLGGGGGVRLTAVGVAYMCGRLGLEFAMNINGSFKFMSVLRTLGQTNLMFCCSSPVDQIFEFSREKKLIVTR